LRFHLNLEILRALHVEIVETIATKWQDVYALAAKWTAYLEDARHVFGTILDQVAAGGKTVRNLIAFEEDAKSVDGLVKAVRDKNPVGEEAAPMRPADRSAFRPAGSKPG
jgi:hypothetical protein